MTLGPMDRCARPGTILFSQDGRHLGFFEETAPGGEDVPPSYALRVVEVKSKGADKGFRMEVKSPVGAIAVSSGASPPLVAFGTGSDVNVYRSFSVNQGTVLRGHEDQVVDVDIDAGGRLLASASGDRTVRLWKPGEGKLVAGARRGTGPPRAGRLEPPRDLAGGGRRGRKCPLLEPGRGPPPLRPAWPGLGLRRHQAAAGSAIDVGTLPILVVGRIVRALPPSPQCRSRGIRSLIDRLGARKKRHFRGLA